MIARLFALTTFVALVGLTPACSNSGSIRPEPPAPVSQTPLVGSVTPVLFAAPAQPLDMVVAVFDQGLVNAAERQQVFPTVRKAESLLLPVLLADALESSNVWGAVRVSQSTSVRVPLIIEGEILIADGEQLELAIVLRGSDDSVLLRRNYRDQAASSDYPVVPGAEPFSDLYRAIANDVAQVVLALSEQQRGNLQRVALMRFATDLAPGTFEQYLARSDVGTYILKSYPAEGDPMLSRLERLRRQDELFVDTVDQEYEELRDRVAESYALWREYSFELQRFGSEYRASAASRKSSARRGSYASMSQSYTSYRKVKIQEEDFGELVSGFTGESLETVLEVDDGVFRLSGSVEQRYKEWQGILARIYDLETGDL